MTGTNIIILIILGIIAVALGYWLGKNKWKHSPVEANAMRNSVLVERQAEGKRENLAVVMELLEKQGKVTNDDVEKMLGVSNATAERYLDELEAEGKIKQVGKTGRSVYYERI